MSVPAEPKLRLSLRESLEAAQESLEPTKPEKQTWTSIHYAVLWLTVVANPASMALGGSLLEVGVEGLWKLLGILFVGKAITLLALCANASAGQKYGLSFPLYARVAFGTHGSQIATISRGGVAIMWLSYQFWAGTQALYSGLVTAWPSLNGTDIDENLNWTQLVIFLSYGALHAAMVHIGLYKTIKFLPVPALLLWGFMIVLFVWSFASVSASDIGDTATSIGESADTQGHTPVFLVGLISVISVWSTMTLNISDLSRFAVSQKAQIVGQTAGFLLPSLAVSMIGGIVTAASQYKYGVPHSDIVSLISEWSPVPSVISGIVLSASILGVNVASNIISPANDIANLGSCFSFKFGGLVSVGLAMCMCPWRIFSGANNFVLKFLSGYAIITGSVLGIMLVDYLILRSCQIDVAAVLTKDDTSQYYFTSGFNLVAITALLLGSGLCMPGFIQVLLHNSSLSGGWGDMYTASWFVSLSVSSFVMAIGMIMFYRSRLSIVCGAQTLRAEEVEQPEPKSHNVDDQLGVQISLSVEGA